MKFKDLLNENRNKIISLYKDAELSKEEAQIILADEFDVSPRTIRNWANTLGLNTLNPKENLAKILIYDIETSQAEFKQWWTGKRWVSHDRMTKEPKIISIAWKWLGEDRVVTDHWDMDTHCDKALLERFLPEYNKADLVIGQNNNKFDNRWINARALKHRLDVDVFVRSFDLMKQAKRLFRLPSYSMGFMTKYLGITLKQNHEGILMWDMIEDGTEKQQEEYMQKMLDYNIGDIISTEEMYLVMRKYMGHIIHVGRLNGKGKYSCPNCGGDHLELIKTTTTPSGTIQRIMKCQDDEVQFKISNSLYLKNNFVENQV